MEKASTSSLVARTLRPAPLIIPGDYLGFAAICSTTEAGQGRNGAGLGQSAQHAILCHRPLAARKLIENGRTWSCIAGCSSHTPGCSGEILCTLDGCNGEEATRNGMAEQKEIVYGVPIQPTNRKRLKNIFRTSLRISIIEIPLPAMKLLPPSLCWLIQA
ncbi:uncharacterized protein BJX67DRAFT_323898 [Aspergillus lucknowensis]|uniref:Uncharacterized protein n=1 Tax=Aspergillus lucknowensis TaxID=176173 RepID=A0ABR4M2K2_9EURO